MTFRAGEPVDLSVRARAAKDLDHSFCIEAGAGTGKTRLLVERFVAIVESGRAKAREIVAITFTEKAAGEMKLRVRREIEKRLGANDDGPVKALLGAALDDIERSPISTIHAFAASILREYPVEAGIDPMFEQLDALEGSLFFDECWSDFLVERAGERGDAIRRFVGFGGSADLLGKMARSAYGRRAERSCEGIFDCSADGVGASGGGSPESGRGRAEGGGEEQMEAFRLEFISRIEALRLLADDRCRDRSDKGFAAIRELARAAEPLGALRGEELERYLFALEIPKPKGVKTNWNPQEACAEQKRGFKELAERQRVFRGRVSDAVAHGLDGLYDDFLRFADRRKAAEGLLDFDDLLIRVRGLCKSPAALEALRRRYRFILVDEFQDTDPVQAEIVWLLAGSGEEGSPAPGKLFVVGDPKQSIYRFRRADVEIYEGFKERLVAEGGVRLSIVQNFRSVPGITEWVNGTFADVMKPPPDGRFQPRYEAIAAARTGEGSPVISFDLEMEESDLSTLAVRRREGEAIARIVHRLVASGLEVMDPVSKVMEPLSYRHIAIVYPGMTDFESYEEPLRAENIPYIVEGGKLYYSREEVRALAAAIWAIEDPYDPIALLGALRTPLFGASDEEIYLFTRSGGRLDYLDPGIESDGEFRELSAAFDLLRDLHFSRNEAGPARTMLALVGRTKFLDLSLLRPHGEQRVANIKKAVASARAFDGAGGYRRFAHWFREQGVLEAEESESPMVEENDDAVRLLTMHKAKGLQFPVVVLANLVQKKRGGPRIIVGRGGKLAFKIGDGLETSDFEELAERDRLRENAESIRLLYVASTRAGDLLVIPRSPKEGGYFETVKGAVDPSKKDAAVAAWRFSEMPPLRGEARPFVRLEEPAAEDRERHELGREEWRRERLDLLERASRAPVLIAPSRLALETGDGTVAPVRKAPDEDPRARVASARAALFGEAFHRVMERWHASRGVSLSQRCAAAALELGIGAETSALERVASAALETELMRRAARATRRFVEAPFILPIEGGFVQGRLDLLFEEAERWAIVDYKTDDIAVDEVDARLASYRPQAAAYALAARRLGFEGPGEVVLFFVRPLVARSIAVTDALIAEADELIRRTGGASPL